MQENLEQLVLTVFKFKTFTKQGAYRDEIRFRQEQKDRLARKTGVGSAADRRW